MLALHDVDLAPHTTIGLGGPARGWQEPSSLEELCEQLATDAQPLILGGGSNLLIGDDGPGKSVIKLGARLSQVRIGPTDDPAWALVIAEAGKSFDALIEECTDAGLAGLEVLSGIPGSVGATPMQNVGAYGREVGELLAWVEVFDRDTNTRYRLDADACAFSYRSSLFRGSERWVILQIALRLPRGELSLPIRYQELARALGVATEARAKLAEVRQAVLALRRSKGMVVDPSDPDSKSCGSFFTNPIVSLAQAERVQHLASERQLGEVPRFPVLGDATKLKLAAGWLIERAGFHKGYGDGAVGISRKHSLALVHRGGGSTRELLDLAHTVARGVYATFGVELKPEPFFVGCAWQPGSVRSAPP